MEKRYEKRTRKIVLLGAESTGKTDLAKYLSKYFCTTYIPEYAREYVENLNREYTYEDVEKIALKQVDLEDNLIFQAGEILFYDTYLIIIKVWFSVVFNRYPKWIENKLKTSEIDLFLVCNNDLDWIADSVRENGGEMRDKLYDIYIKELDNYNFNYEIVRGIGEERRINAIRIVENYIKNNSRC